MATEERKFDVYDVLAVTHHLPSTGSQFRGILEHISGQTLLGPTNALGVQEPCARWLIEQHPQLNTVPAPPEFNGDERAMDAWADQQKARLGTNELPVKPLPEDRRAQIEPTKERLLGHVDPAKTYVANPAPQPDVGLGR